MEDQMDGTHHAKLIVSHKLLIMEYIKVPNSLWLASRILIVSHYSFLEALNGGNQTDI